VIGRDRAARSASISRLRATRNSHGRDWPVVAAQLRQVTPGPDECFLHDVIGARPVRAEPLDVAVQGPGVIRVQLAERGIGVAG